MTKAIPGAQMAIIGAMEALVSRLRHWEIMAEVMVVMAVGSGMALRIGQRNPTQARCE